MLSHFVRINTDITRIRDSDGIANLKQFNKTMSQIHKTAPPSLHSNVSFVRTTNMEFKEH